MNHRSIQNGTPLSAAHPTLGTEMRKAGYDPLLFGYTDAAIDPQNLHPNDPALREDEGVAPGFSEIVRLRFQDPSTWLGYLKSKGYELPDNYWETYNAVSQNPAEPAAINDPAIYKAEDSDTAFLTDRTLQEMSVRTHLDWFATVTYIRPHPPLVAPAPYNAMYDPDNIPAAFCPNSITEMKSAHPFFKAYFNEPNIKRPYSVINGQIEKSNEDAVAQLRAVYFGLITELDDHIGRLIDHLRDTGQYDDTLIVFTADHGEMLGDHHLWGKNTPHNASFHVPLIIRDPRRRDSAGTTINTFTESIDIAPTLLDWVGQKPPPGFNGHSLLPMLEGNKPKDWRTHIFAEMDMSDQKYGARFQRQFNVKPHQCNLAILMDENFKLVYFNGGVAPLLYDMQNDPDETTNLANDPAHADTLLTMTRKMLDHKMTHAHHALSRLVLTGDGLAEA